MRLFDQFDIPARKYTLDDGVSLYAQWARGLDAFDSPAFRDPRAFLEWLDANHAVYKNREDFRGKIEVLIPELEALEPRLDISQVQFTKTLALIEKLKKGGKLTDEECVHLYYMSGFVESVLYSEPHPGYQREDGERPYLYGRDDDDHLAELVDRVFVAKAQATMGLPLANEVPEASADEIRQVGIHLETYYDHAKLAVPKGWENVLTYTTPLPE